MQVGCWAKAMVGVSSGAPPQADSGEDRPAHVAHLPPQLPLGPGPGSSPVPGRPSGVFLPPEAPTQRTLVGFQGQTGWGHRVKLPRPPAMGRVCPVRQLSQQAESQQRLPWGLTPKG